MESKPLNLIHHLGALPNDAKLGFARACFLEVLAFHIQEVLAATGSSQRDEGGVSFLD